MNIALRVAGSRGWVTCVVLSLSLVFIGTIAAQEYQEIDDFGWSRGIDWTVPTLADIDGNGLLDLVVGSESAGIGRWEQTAVHSASFRRVQRDYFPGLLADRCSPFMTDVDGNGRLDLLLGNGGNYVWHYEQNAAGALEFTRSTDRFGEVATGNNNKPWFGDLDGDGVNDLIVASSADMTPRYVQGSTQPATFTRVRDLAFSQHPGYYLHLLPCDLDGDGILEAFAGSSRGLRLYRQDAVARDSFVLVQEKWNGITDLEMATTAIADLDGDGLLDLLVGTITGHVRHYEQPSTGAVDGWVLRNENVIGTWDYGFYTMGFVTDLDGDGRLDILRSEVRSDANDVPLPIHHFRTRQAGGYEVEYVGAFSGIGMRKNEALTVTDFENDGRRDMLIYRVQKGVEYYRQSATDPFRFDLVSEDFLPGVYTVQPGVPTVADIDSNGRLDIIIASTDNKLFRYEADSPGAVTFTKTGDPWMRSAGLYPSLCFFDYANDGLLDMLQGRHDGTIVHWRQTAAGSSTYEQINTPVASIDVTSRSQPMVYDVNLDGRLDIIVADGAGGISLFIDEGPNAVMLPPSASTLQLRAPWPQPATDLLHVMVTTTATTPMRLSLVDILGRETGIARDIAAGVTASRTIALPVRDLVPGVYLLRVAQGGRMVSRPVIVGK